MQQFLATGSAWPPWEYLVFQPFMMRCMRRNLCIFENNDTQDFQQILLEVGVGGSQHVELLGMGGDFADPAFLKRLYLLILSS